MSAREKIDAISHFAGRVVHDLNNFSTIIINVTELLKDDLESNEEGLLKIKMLEDTGARLLSYTQEINSIRLGKNHSEGKCDVFKLLTNIHENHELKDQIFISSQENNANLDTNLDETGLRKIFGDIIQNAQEASGDKFRLEINISISNNFVKINFRDYGSGFNSKSEEHIFEPYFSSKENVKGSGLSLSQAYAFLTDAGGSISAENACDQGAIINISLPCLSAAKISPEKKTAKKVILLVDDQEELRKVTRAMLIKSGYEILEAANGVEALKIAEQKKYKIELLISDINMPKMGGQELASKLSKSISDLKIIFMSGYNDDGSYVDQNNPNMTFVDKPFKKSNLIEKIKDLF